jgi:VCBS repeat-containing protein
VSAPNGVLANDEDSDSAESNLTTAVVSEPTNGTLLLSENGSFEYTPEAGFTGTDTFTYEVTDGEGGTATATVSLEVNTTERNVNLCVNSTTPVDTEDELSVTVTLENPDNITANRTVLLIADETVVDNETVIIEGGAETTLTLDGMTDAEDNDIQTLTVSTANTNLTRNVTIDTQATTDHTESLTTGADGPGFGIGVTVGVLIIVATLGYRRR